MNLIFRSVATVFLISSCLQVPASAGPERSSVWQVKSDTNTVYLAGAIALLREGDQPLPPQFGQAYEASERVVFEVDPDESNDEEAGQLAIKMGMFEDGRGLEADISAETYDKLGRFLDGAGAPRAAMDQFRPWFAAVMISMTEMMKIGARPDLGVGQIIQDRALKDGKPTAGLDAMEVELGLLRDLPAGAHEYMLNSALDDVGTMEEELDKFVAAWRAGDIAALEALDAEDDTDWDKLINKTLVHDRSAKWVGSIENVLAGDESTLFVVGVGHLIGEQSLVEMLRARGYAVEQLGAGGGAGQEEKGKAAKKPKLIPVSLHLGLAGA